MSRDYSERDLQRYIRGEIPAMGTPKSEWRKKLERDIAEEAAKPRPVVTDAHIQARRVRSITGEPRLFSGAPCTVCHRPMRDDAKGAMHERCARKREHCACGCVLKINWPLLICGKCFRAAEREKSLAGKRICAEPGCGKILQVNNSYPKCREHSYKLRNARNTLYKREKRKALKNAERLAA